MQPVMFLAEEITNSKFIFSQFRGVKLVDPVTIVLFFVNVVKRFYVLKPQFLFL